MSEIPMIEEPNLQAICNVLGDTNSGLTGSEIGTLLQMCQIEDTDISLTKRHRLFNALQKRQRQDNCGKNIFLFIHTAMSPVNFIKRPERFDDMRSSLNNVLAFAGYMLDSEGELQESEKVVTLPEARKRAKKLLEHLEIRGVHADVLRFCKAELLQDNYFHAVFEATKSVADKIRDKSGLTEDGSELVDKAFALGKTNNPLLAFNSLQTDSECSEQKGLINLIKGLFGAFRNTTAHVPKINWNISEQDALDILTLASLIHRRLDDCVKKR